MLEWLIIFGAISVLVMLFIYALRVVLNYPGLLDWKIVYKSPLEDIDEETLQFEYEPTPLKSLRNKSKLSLRSHFDGRMCHHDLEHHVTIDGLPVCKAEDCKAGMDTPNTNSIVSSGETAAEVYLNMGDHNIATAAAVHHHNNNNSISNNNNNNITNETEKKLKAAAAAAVAATANNPDKDCEADKVTVINEVIVRQC